MQATWASVPIVGQNQICRRIVRQLLPSPKDGKRQRKRIQQAFQKKGEPPSKGQVVTSRPFTMADRQETIDSTEKALTEEKLSS